MEPALGLIGGGLANEAELELGLGLSLGSVGVAGKFKKSSNVGWGGGLILTAKDFSHGGGFQSSGRAAAAAVVSGTKRAAADSYNNVGSPPSGSSQVVGWPPIRAYRMNTLANNNNQTKVPNDDDEPEEEEEDGAVNESKDKPKKMNHHHHGNFKDDDTANSLIINEIKGRFVKVNMDGIPIGRKVDLGAHNCYKTLSQTLEDMFFKSTTKVVNSISNRRNQQKGVPFKLLDGSSEFVLTYEDKDGDWMLVGDVPWGMFLGTVKRLRIMRTSEANGLAPSIQERHGRRKGRLI